MKKCLSLLALSALVIMPVSNVQAAGSVPYKNQRAGQFCKAVDIGKTVKLPDGVKLKCKQDGPRARWKR